MAAAVSSRATPRVLVMSDCTIGLAGPSWCRAPRVISAAGMLPAHSWPTTRQGTSFWRARLTVPPILVKAANSRSVPTAR